MPRGTLSCQKGRENDSRPRFSGWFLCFVLSLSSLNAQTGGIQGTFDLSKLANQRQVAVEKYVGKISGKVAPLPLPVAGVWLMGPGLSAPANPPVVTLAQRGYQFTKGLVVVPLKTTILFPNEDPDFHNIYSLSRAKRFDIGRYKKEEYPIPSVLFDKLGYIRLNCEIHEHMRAHVIVVDSPYYTVTDVAGNFTLKGIPPGNYILHAQGDKKNKWKGPVTVTANQLTPVFFNK